MLYLRLPFVFSFNNFGDEKLLSVLFSPVSVGELQRPDLFKFFFNMVLVFTESEIKSLQLCFYEQESS